VPEHTNTIQGWKNAPYRGASIQNCAACTAAGAVNLTLGHGEHTSGKVASALGTKDGKFTMGDSTVVQAQAILAYVVKATGRQALSLDGEQSLTDAENWMRSKPEKTVFAVLASGFVPHDGENKCHWLNAVLAGGTIRYFDFQSQRVSAKGGDFVGHGNPSTSGNPFIGVVTQSQPGATNKKMHSAAQAGSFDDGVKLSLIAFPPQ
jgi:hypothetical protein